MIYCPVCQPNVPGWMALKCVDCREPDSEDVDAATGTADDRIPRRLVAAMADYLDPRLPIAAKSIP
jgi:hypothetical protein